MEVIQKNEEIIKELNVSILNNFYTKMKGGDKLNRIISIYLLEIKKQKNQYVSNIYSKN